jgi:hypothetical protein
VFQRLVTAPSELGLGRAQAKRIQQAKLVIGGATLGTQLDVSSCPSKHPKWAEGGTMRETEYDYRNCSSLFGYAAAVHARSGGICQLCGCGSGERPDFDLWRQLTVEHLVGEGQGGYPAKIKDALTERFPDLSSDQRERLVERIGAANTITACSFCNSTTSRDRSDRSMTQLIVESPDEPDETCAAITTYCTAILERKRSDVAWKLTSVKAAFERVVLQDLRHARVPVEPVSNTGVGRAFQERVGRILSHRFGEEIILEVELPIGTPPRPHRFDLVSRSGSVVCECKAYTWTSGGNIPSAKVTTLREAAGYLTQAPMDSAKILAIAHSASPRRRETLGEYFVRLNGGLLTDIAVIEIDEADNVRQLNGQLKFSLGRGQSLDS